jgi:Winged helix-turn helix
LNPVGDSRQRLRVRIWGRRTGISIELTPADRLRLEGIIRSRNAPQKQVWRAEIVRYSADGLGTVEIMRRTGKSKTCVWRWQERFAEQGVDGLLRDKTRPSRLQPLGQEVIDTLVKFQDPKRNTNWQYDCANAYLDGAIQR